MRDYFGVDGMKDLVGQHVWTDVCGGGGDGSVKIIDPSTILIPLKTKQKNQIKYVTRKRKYQIKNITNVRISL